MSKSSIQDKQFMSKALNLAMKAASIGETPVGALIVRNNEVIGTGHNRVEIDKDPTAHAEMLAIRDAAACVEDWRLSGTTMYVTLEPCIMCAAALLHARIERLVFGAFDKHWGGLGSLFDFSHDPRINHELEVVSGILAEECANVLVQFFQELREPNL
jgi:tRNA(adenine34) deaminase